MISTIIMEKAKENSKKRGPTNSPHFNLSIPSVGNFLSM